MEERVIRRKIERYLNLINVGLHSIAEDGPRDALHKTKRKLGIGMFISPGQWAKIHKVQHHKPSVQHSGKIPEGDVRIRPCTDLSGMGTVHGGRKRWRSQLCAADMP